MSMKRPVVISGPSGAGKSTLIGMLQMQSPGQYAFSVSHTTRKPREGEANGVAYHFVSREEFTALVDAGGFIEYTESYGNLYGTSVQAVIAASSDPHVRCLVDIDSVGVKNFKERCKDLNAIYIFVSPPSFDVLQTRLTKRGAEDEAALRLRLDQCEQELDYARSGAYDAVVINADLDRAFALLHDLIEEKKSVGDDPRRLVATSRPVTT
ncbi:guanylate kinase, converts GMP to GDP [Auricularia subglabra TFB-10046 SS5]|nr:guanylate kinase, converts GMP to GDP [Auricularia subglabra TFB-10046 SS5]